MTRCLYVPSTTTSNTWGDKEADSRQHDIP